MVSKKSLGRNSPTGSSPERTDEKPEIKNSLKLGKNFNIYVLETKSGNFFREFDLISKV